MLACSPRLLRLVWFFSGGHQTLVLENLALRQQIAILKRKRTRPRLTRCDRLFWIALAGYWKCWRKHVFIVHPDTVVCWQRRRFARHWAQLSKRPGQKPGRPRISKQFLRTDPDDGSRQPGIAADGRTVFVRRSEIIGTVAELPTRRDAELILSNKLRYLNSANYHPRSCCSFREFVEEWKAQALPALKYATQKHYEYVIDIHLLPVFGNVQLRLISQESIQSLFGEQAQEGSFLAHGQTQR